MDISQTAGRLTRLKEGAESFFDALGYVFEEEEAPSFAVASTYFTPVGEATDYWSALSQEHQGESLILQEQLLSVVSSIVDVMSGSPLLDKADERDIGISTKRAIASLKLRKFQAWDTEVIHDEGRVLGVVPPRQSETEPSAPPEAREAFYRCVEKLEGMLTLLSASPLFLTDGLPQKDSTLAQPYRRNTAFIMMPINPGKPRLQDVYDTYKTCFDLFDITATRADEIEHEGVITNRIMEEIRTSEFLVGDLTDERPSVYYEIGYAHALGRRVIMFRESGTRIHFDLAVHNCPEYENLSKLKQLLLRRLESLTNKKAKDG